MHFIYATEIENIEKLYAFLLLKLIMLDHPWEQALSMYICSTFV
jgi:hypothetical protein